MNRQSLLGLGFGVLTTLAVVGCASSPATAPAARTARAPHGPAVHATLAADVAGPNSTEPNEDKTPAAERLVVFVGGAGCAGLERTEIDEPDATPEAAIRHILESKSLSNLSLEDPKVNIEAGSARIDLKMAAGSSHGLHVMSHCEQTALLGAISNTLKANPRWHVRHVVFTTAGSLFAIGS